MLEAVIFDMDGTLINSIPIHRKLWEIIMKKTDFVKLTEDEHEINGMNLREMIVYLKEKHNLNIDIDEIFEMKKELEGKMFEDEAELFDGAERLLKELNDTGIKCALATSSTKSLVDIINKKFNLERYISVFVSAGDVKKSKPEPEIFLLAAERLGIDPSKCVVIEDAPHGVTAAKRGGMKVIGVTTTQPREHFENADLVVDSLKEIDLKTLENI